MNRFLQISLAVASLVVAAAISFACWRLSVALDKWGDGGAAAFAGLNQALATVNRGCAPGPCGSLANIDKTVIKVGDAIVTTQIQERAATPHVTAAMDQFADAAQHLSKTSDALTVTAQGASATLATTNDTIRGLQPLEASLNATAEASTRTIDSLDARISSPVIDRILGHVDSTTGHVDDVAGNAAKVSDKLTTDYLAPVPWYRKITRVGGDLLDIGGAIARQVP